MKFIQTSCLPIVQSRRFKWTNQYLARYLTAHTILVRLYTRLTTPVSKFCLIHSGEASIETRFGLVIGRLHEGEIFGEVGHIISRLRTVTARAATKCIVKVIDDETLKTKLQEADPVCLALIRGLAMRISDANEAAENYWRELSVYKSLHD